MIIDKRQMTPIPSLITKGVVAVLLYGIDFFFSLSSAFAVFG